MYRLTKLTIAILAALLTTISGAALADGTAADQFVQGRQVQLNVLLQQPKNPSREKKVAAAIDEVFDYEQLAARSLGDEWKNRSDDERRQFRELLEQLVRQSYRKSIDATLGYAVEYRGTRKSGDDTVVITIAKHKTDSRKAPVSIDYVLARVGENWRAVDVVVEGSSLTGNYRSQFTRVIKKKGFPELLSKMKLKIQKGE